MFKEINYNKINYLAKISGTDEVTSQQCYGQKFWDYKSLGVVFIGRMKKIEEIVDAERGSRISCPASVEALCLLQTIENIHPQMNILFGTTHILFKKIKSTKFMQVFGTND